MTDSWYARIPKTELHLHLEGAIPLQALWELMQKYGGDAHVQSVESLQEKFIFRDFPHFIETWCWKNQFLREYEDFTFIAAAVAQDLLDQNIRYVEAFFSPPDFLKLGLELQPLTVAIRKGLDRVPGIKIALVADLVRDFGPQRGAQTLQEINEVQDEGVIGIGIGGSEQLFPPEPFAEVYDQARELGFHTSAHAGEVAGAKSIWGAIDVLKVDRIGHGTRAEEDPRLLDALKQREIPIEMCPMSNICTGSAESNEAHPVRRYFEHGLLISINTDDPKMFGNSLAQEYHLLAEVHGFNREEIKEVVLNGVRTSWLEDSPKAELMQEMSTDPIWKEQ